MSGVRMGISAPATGTPTTFVAVSSVLATLAPIAVTAMVTMMARPAVAVVSAVVVPIGAVASTA